MMTRDKIFKRLKSKKLNMEQKKRMLLVEDDSFVSSIYQTKLEHEGFEVALATNGLEALKQLEGGTFDMVLLDIIMPYMDGIETLRKMKGAEAWKNIPVILLTNLSEREKIEEALGIGANDYLIKSHFTPSEVIEKINALFKKIESDKI
jgi:DNA-binding response OmpR family regulator